MLTISAAQGEDADEAATKDGQGEGTDASREFELRLGERLLPLDLGLAEERFLRKKIAFVCVCFCHRSWFWLGSAL
jgi:hypothetical protein